MLLGNRIYALTVTYQPDPVRYRGEIVGLNFYWTFNVEQTKVPIETILGRGRIETTGMPCFNLENRTFTLTFNMLVWASNRIKLFERTFNFEDVDPRQITVYLHNYKVDYDEIHVEVSGHYNLNGTKADFEVGEVLET